MNYEQVDVALMFLEEFGEVVIQVPFGMDIPSVKEHLVKRLGRPQLVPGRNLWVYMQGHIRFETLGVVCGMGYRSETLFFIDRVHDRSYYERLEIVG